MIFITKLQSVSCEKHLDAATEYKARRWNGDAKRTNATEFPRKTGPQIK